MKQEPVVTTGGHAPTLEARCPTCKSECKPVVGLVVMTCSKCGTEFRVYLADFTREGVQS